MRRAVALLTTALLLTMLPATALAWANGPTRNGGKGEGYGTHDWILDRAIQIAGAQGAWVVRDTALHATDDPDYNRTPVNWHWATATGALRGAPFATGEYYHNAVVAFREGRFKDASRYLGAMSHFFADANEPFHTGSGPSAHGTLHATYELAVDRSLPLPTSCISWVTPRAPMPIADVRVKTLQAATYARARFASLVTGYTASHSVRTGVSGRITRQALTRAANDLADIIVSIPLQSGEATAPTVIDMPISTEHPRQYRKVGTSVTLTDVNGLPIEAVYVVFTWKLPSGTATSASYTDANGFTASKMMDIANSPIGVPVPVTASIKVNGVTTVTTRWYTPR